MFISSAKFLRCSASTVLPLASPSVYWPFLGHQLSSSGCSPLEKHISAISSIPHPNKPALQKFLGKLNFYRKSIKNCSIDPNPHHQCPQGPR